MSEPLELTGDPWIDAYLTFRQAWCEGATESELTHLGRAVLHEAPAVAASAAGSQFRVELLERARAKATQTADRCVTEHWTND
jgi:hypothetical protein